MKRALVTLGIPVAAFAIAACQAEFRDTYGPSTAALTPQPAETTPAPSPVRIVPAPDPTQKVAPTAPATSGAPSVTPAPTTPPAPAGPTTGSISGTISVRPQALSYGGKNIVVWLDNPPSQPPAEDRGTMVTLDQRGMTFIPILSVVHTGGKVVFQNGDPFPHNIFTPDYEKFNLGTMPHGSSSVKQFDHVGRYALLCNLHTNMLAYIIVTPSSWFAQPDKDGKFTIPGVPNGTYTVKAWGGRMSQESKSVTVDGKDAVADFQLQQAD